MFCFLFFFTQSKTNLRYTLIVVIIAVIVGGGIWLYKQNRLCLDCLWPPVGWITYTDPDNLFTFSSPFSLPQILVRDYSDKESVESEWQSNSCDLSRPEPDIGCAPIVNKETKAMSINGNNVYWKVDGNNDIWAYIPNEKKNITVILRTWGFGAPGLREEDLYKREEDFQKILSTFRFLD